jgi:hypothetical protein
MSLVEPKTARRRRQNQSAAQLLQFCCSARREGWRPAIRSRSKIGSGTGIRTLNLAVNRSGPPVQKSRFVFAHCRSVPPNCAVRHRRCCTSGGMKGRAGRPTTNIHTYKRTRERCRPHGLEDRASDFRPSLMSISVIRTTGRGRSPRASGHAGRLAVPVKSLWRPSARRFPRRNSPAPSGPRQCVGLALAAAAGAPPHRSCNGRGA